MEHLLQLIYHERQQPGSMLCAQHALNNLLQGHYFSAPDLAMIGGQLDEEERNVREPNRRRKESTNMDDTGFFSVQVLENALQVWDLTLARWRSEEFRDAQSTPEFQAAFILNLEQHWYTIRRFGSGSKKYHWFSLNSFNRGPEWISNTYLGMTLQQAELEGYSVFVVRNFNGSSPTKLPDTDVDAIADSVDPAKSNPTAFSNLLDVDDDDDDDMDDGMMGDSFMQDDDFELQRALQESLNVTNPHGVSEESVPAEEEDQVAIPDEALAAFQASAARQRSVLAQAKLEQEAALRYSLFRETRSRPSRKKTKGEEEEEELTRRAMQQSMENHNEDESSSSSPMSYLPSGSARRFPDAPTTPPPPSSKRQSAQARSKTLGPRILDDEDAELQAALKASLEYMPPDLNAPEGSQSSSRAESTASRPQNPPRSKTAPAHLSIPEVPSSQEESSTTTTSSPMQEKSPTVEELRRIRLARFGG